MLLTLPMIHVSNRGKLARLRAAQLREEKLNREAKSLVLSWENEKLRKDLDNEDNRLVQLQKTIEDSCRPTLGTVKHNFEAEQPPPFRCCKPNCGATFVDVKHLSNHSSCGKKHMGALQAVLQDQFGYNMVKEEIGGKGFDKVDLDICLWLSLQQLRVCFVGSPAYVDASTKAIGYIKDLANKMVVVPVYKTTTTHGYIDPSSLMSLNWWTLQQILNHYSNLYNEGGGVKRSEAYQKFKDILRNMKTEDRNKAREKILSEAYHNRILEARVLKVELQNLKTYQMESDLAIEACNTQLLFTCEAIFVDVTAAATVEYVAERKAVTSVVNSILKELVQKAVQELTILKRDLPGKALNGIIDASVALTRAHQVDTMVCVTRD